MYLLDTNVISELVAKAPNREVVKWIDSLDSDDICLSVITIGEIRKGVERLPESHRKSKLRQWLAGDLLSRFADRILPLDVAAMLKWGDMMAGLEKSGVTLPAIDSLLAAQALLHQCMLVTRNTKDFRGTGVPLFDPWGCKGI